MGHLPASFETGSVLDTFPPILARFKFNLLDALFRAQQTQDFIRKRKKKEKRRERKEKKQNIKKNNSK